MVLQHAVSQLLDACDPDHPLDPAEWGKLENHSNLPRDNWLPIDAAGEDLSLITSWRVGDADEKEEVGP